MVNYGVIFMRNKIFFFKDRSARGQGMKSKDQDNWGDDSASNQQPRASTSSGRQGTEVAVDPEARKSMQKAETQRHVQDLEQDGS